MNCMVSVSPVGCGYTGRPFAKVALLYAWAEESQGKFAPGEGFDWQLNRHCLAPSRDIPDLKALVPTENLPREASQLWGRFQATACCDSEEFHGDLLRLSFYGIKWLAHSQMTCNGKVGMRLLLPTTFFVL